jgi:hypothetical protein
MENGFTKAINSYPTTIASDYNLLINYKNYKNPSGRVFDDSGGVTFTNYEKEGQRYHQGQMC